MKQELIMCMLLVTLNLTSSQISEIGDENFWPS